MFGFGDDKKPDDASLELLEIYVEEFITNLVSRSLARNSSNVVSVQNILKVLS